MAINKRLQTASAESIGRAIKSAREAIGLTQSELGDKIGVAKTTICKWEQGRTLKFSRTNIAALSKALHVSPAKILGWEGDLSVAQEAIQEEILNPVSVTTYRHNKSITNLLDVNYIVHKENGPYFIDIDHLEPLQIAPAGEISSPADNADKILTEIINVYQKLSIRDQLSILNYAYELEEKNNQ